MSRALGPQALSPEALELARAPLLMLDYDGVLAEIVAVPSEAWPHPEAPELLQALAVRYPLFVVTGRRIDDLAALLAVPGLRAVGVHGMEEGTLGEQARPLVAPGESSALKHVRSRLPKLDVPPLEGLKVEDKGIAVALHYREVEDEEAARRALEAWAVALPDSLERLWGKRVLELRPRGYGKGRAVARLVAEHPGRTPVFVGDDTTDEEAFAVLDEGVTIKVGPGETRARYRLAGVAKVVAYLRRYLEGSLH